MYISDHGFRCHQNNVGRAFKWTLKLDIVFILSMSRKGHLKISFYSLLCFHFQTARQRMGSRPQPHGIAHRREHEMHCGQ